MVLVFKFLKKGETVNFFHIFNKAVNYIGDLLLKNLNYHL